MARENHSAHANPKPIKIKTGVDCRTARPKFSGGAWSPAKISDVTGGGLFLFVTPDVARPGDAASKPWRMGYRVQGHQKTYSIDPYANGRDGTFSLADARRERDKAKDQLKAKTRAPRSNSTTQAGGKPTFRSMGRRVAREEKKWRKSNAAGL